MRDDNGSHSYVVLGYDTALRLQSEAYYAGGSDGSGGTLGETITYTYDANGNRTKLVNASGTFTNAITGGFRLTAVTNSGSGTLVESYAYDGGGRVTNSIRSGLNAKLGYNAADQLTQVTITNGSTTNFAFTVDGAGRRVKATANGAAERRFLVASTVGDDLESPHLVADGSNSLKAGYVFLDGRPIVRYSASSGTANVYYLEDGMGSIIGLVDTYQASVAVFTYDGFGQTRSAAGSQAAPPAGTGGDFRFHGLWLEADTGLYHARARDYDPRTGRFLSRDPSQGSVKEPESLNPYPYALNNPCIASDPSGEFSIVELNFVSGKQFTLQGLRSAALNYARRKVVDEFTSAVGNLIEGQLQEIIGLHFPRLKNLPFIRDVFEGGKNFDRLAGDAMCGLVGAIPGFEEAVHVGVRIVDKGPRMGEPITNGKDCSGKRSLITPRGFTRGLSYSVPDFIIGEQPISEFAKGRAVTRFNQSFLVGDFKFSARALYNSYVAKGATQPEQFDAIAAYAGDHTYMHTALFIVLRSGNSAKYGLTGPEWLQTKAMLGSKALRRGTLPVMVILFGK